MTEPCDVCGAPAPENTPDPKPRYWSWDFGVCEKCFNDVDEFGGRLVPPRVAKVLLGEESR